MLWFRVPRDVRRRYKAASRLNRAAARARLAYVKLPTTEDKAAGLAYEACIRAAKRYENGLLPKPVELPAVPGVVKGMTKQPKDMTDEELLEALALGQAPPADENEQPLRWCQENCAPPHHRPECFRVRYGP